LSDKNVKQGSNEYNVSNIYVISFTPYSVSKTNKMNILLSYPATVNPATNSENCFVTAGTAKTTAEDCTKIENARLFKIMNAIPPNYSGEVKIQIEL
jgi:hypothetical protein